MSFTIKQQPQVESSAQAQLELKIAQARRNMKDPHELIEHVIKLYGAEFIKANDRITALEASLKASGELLAEQKRANDELFRIKQRVVIANRELMQRNIDLREMLMEVRSNVGKKLAARITDYIEAPPAMDAAAVEAHKVRAEDTPA